MKQYIKNIAFIAFIAGLFTACNKEAATTRAVSFELTGYNTGSNNLEVSIDTVVFSKYPMMAKTAVTFRKVYTYPSSKNETEISVKDKQSGKEIWKQTVRLSGPVDLERYYPFVYVDGKVVEINPPAADPATNKIAFYIHYPASNDAVDVFIKNEAGQIAYFAKNVKPGTLVYSDFVMPKNFFQNVNGSHYVHCTKAGTTDQWAFENNETKSKTTINNNGLLLPLLDTQIGNVRIYFLTPGSYQLFIERLFKIPTKP